MLTTPAGVTSLTVSSPALATKRLPAESKARPTGPLNPEAKVETVGVPWARERDRDAERAGALAHGLAAGAELHLRRLGDGQRVDRGTAQGGAPVGVPRVKVSVWLGPGSERSVPVMFWVVCPIPNVSGLAVTPL